MLRREILAALAAALAVCAVCMLVVASRRTLLARGLVEIVPANMLVSGPACKDYRYRFCF